MKAGQIDPVPAKAVPDATTPSEAAEEAFAESLAAWDEAMAQGGRESCDDVTTEHETRDFLRQVELLWPRHIAEPPSPSSILGKLGRLELQRVLGVGGFAVVYLARDTVLQRDVAVKLPLPETIFNPTVRARFLREARVIARLRHPHILSIHDIGELVASCYLVTQYCSGGNLAAWLSNRADPVPVRLAAVLVSNLARAIQYAHEQGVLHRDLKPSNILLDPTETAPGLEEFGWTPRVCDFGLAKTFQEGDASRAQSELTLTAGAAVLGTPLYMAPEQAQGQPDALNATTDVHALGTILYELLTGEPPFRAATQLATLRRVVEDDARSVRASRPEVPRDLAAVVEKCLQKSSAKRYPSAQALADDIDRFLAGQPTLARPTPAWERGVKWARRHPARAGIWCVALASMILLSAGLGWHLYQTELFVEALQQSATREKRHAEVAESHRTTAMNKAAEAERLRRLAFEEHEKAAQQSYAATIRVAAHYFKEGRLELTSETLRQQWPGPEDKDRRGLEWYWLWEAGRSLRALRGHESDVNAVAFTSDGNCVSASADLTIRTWNPSNGAALSTTTGLRDRPQFAQFNAAGRRLLVTSPNVLEVWDMAPPRRIAERKVRTLEYMSSLSPDGNKVLFRDSTLQRFVLWDLTTNSVSDIGTPSSERVRHTTFSPDGKRVAVSLMRGETASVVEIWDLSKNTKPCRLPGARGVVHMLSWQDHLLAVGDQLRGVSVWDVNQCKLVRTLPQARDEVTDVQLSPSGRSLLVTESFTKVHTRMSRVTWWDITKEKAAAKILEPGELVRNMGFSPDEHTLAIACGDGLIRLWTPNPHGKPDGVRTLSGHWPLAAWAVAFAPQGDVFASAGDAGLVYLWDRATMKHRATLLGHAALVTSASFSPDSRWLATGSYDRQVLLWDVANKKIKTRIANQDKVRCLAFSSDGQRLASAGHATAVSIFDLDGKPLASLTGHQGQVRSLAFSSSAPLLVTASEDRTAILWDLTENKRVHTFVHSHEAWCTAFSPDGKLIAVGTRDGGVYVWDVHSRKSLAVLRRQQEGIRSLAFSPDGNTLASASQGGSVRLWHVPTLQDLVELPDAGGEINHLAISPDGRQLMASRQNGTLGLWNSPRIP